MMVPIAMTINSHCSLSALAVRKSDSVRR